MLRLLLLVLVSLVAALGLLGLAGRARHHARARRAMDALAAGARPQRGVVRHDALPAGLPEVVRRWLIRAVPDGAPVPTRVSLAQRGLLRMKPGAAGSPLRARQVYAIEPLGFVWDADVRVGGVPVYGLDRLSEGAATFSGRLAGLVTLFSSEGPDVRRASLLRVLAEAVWFPQALAGGGAVRWAPVDAHRARAILTVGGDTVEGVFEFDPTDRPVAFTAERPRDVGGRSVLTPWRGEYTDWVRVDGVEVPARAEVSWLLPEGRHTYWEAAIENLRFED